MARSGIPNAVQCNSAPAPFTSATSRDPQTGAVVPPIHVAIDVRAAGRRRVGRVRLLAQRQPHAEGVRDDAGVAGRRASAALAFASRHGGDALRRRCCSNAGDHVVAGADIYGGTYRLLHKIANRAGIDVTLADSTDLAAVEAAITPNDEAAVDRKPRQSADVDHRHRGRARRSPSGAARCWASTTRSPRPC